MTEVTSVYEAAKYAKLVGDILESYSFPHVDPDIDSALSPYKIWKFPLDGYDVVVHYTKSSVKNMQIISLQVWEEDLSFLPFVVTIKVAKIFFNANYISLMQLKNVDKYLYCWSLMIDEEGNVLKPMENFVEECKYQNMTYFLINENITF